MWKVIQATEGYIFVEREKPFKRGAPTRFIFWGAFAKSDADELAKYLNDLET